MAFLSGGGPAARQQSSLFELEFPRSLAVYDTYAEAQQAVDFLADKKFEVKNLCIVGTDLKSVERVLGRRNWGTVIGNGALSGVSTGLLIGLIMLLFIPGTPPLLLLLVAIVLSVILSIVFQSIAYAASGGRRDFTSVTQTVATRYEILCEHKAVNDARSLLTEMPGGRAKAFDPAVGAAGTASANEAPTSHPGPEQQDWSRLPAGQQDWSRPADQPAPPAAQTPPPAPYGERTGGYGPQGGYDVPGGPHHDQQPYDQHAHDQQVHDQQPHDQRSADPAPGGQQGWAPAGPTTADRPDLSETLGHDRPDRTGERTPWPVHSPVTPPVSDDLPRQNG